MSGNFFGDYSERTAMAVLHQISRVGPGLHNLGNTCFANSVLQCLTHTAPLVDYMLSCQHSQKCRSEEFCMTCTMELHINMALRESCSVMTPDVIINHLPFIAEHFILGQQEDAHEFLCYLIDKMQRSCINPIAFDVDAEHQTNLIDQIFSGNLKTQVVCQNCQYTSDRYEKFINLPVDINSGDTVCQSLQDFVKEETLEGDNAYQCDQCNQLVTAKKRCTIDAAPQVLTISLKRFCMFTGKKLHKKIFYPETLDIDEYMSQCNGPIRYNLYGVLVHKGYSAQSGHYYAYVKANDENWYKMNDSWVTHSNTMKVLNQEAYMLFYLRAPDESRGQQSAECCPCDNVPDQTISMTCSEDVTSSPKSQSEQKSRSPKRGFFRRKWKKVKSRVLRLFGLSSPVSKEKKKV